jgi:hypothetical protein
MYQVVGEKKVPHFRLKTYDVNTESAHSEESESLEKLGFHFLRYIDRALYSNWKLFIYEYHTN